MKKDYEKQFHEAVDQPGHESWVTMEPDGHIAVHARDEDYHFADLLPEEQEKALAWLKANLMPRESPIDHPTSYSMKHVLERRTNIYMTNTQFKELMLLCGYYPAEVDELNWRYCVSKESPICKRQKDGLDGLLIPECVMDYHQE